MSEFQATREGRAKATSASLAAVAAAAQAMREDRAEYRASLLEYRRTLREAHEGGHSYGELAGVAGVTKSAIAQAVKWTPPKDSVASSDAV